MQTPFDTSRLHSMYSARVPEPSNEFWNGTKQISFIAPARSRLMCGVRALRQTSPTPVCILSERLANGEYRIVVNKIQLQRIVAQAFSTPLSQL